MRYLLTLMAVSACGSDPGAPPISAEPTTATELQALPLPPAPTGTPDDPVTPAPAPAPDGDELIEAPLPGAPPDPAPPDGWHDAGACYLPNILYIGECKCAVYDPAGKLIEGGNMCFDSCKYNDEGIAEMHAFCVDGGLPKNRTWTAGAWR